MLARTLYRLAQARRRMPARRPPKAHPRVLHVAPCLFGPDGMVGGGERASYELARAIARETPTTLVSFGPERSSRRDDELRVEIYKRSGTIEGQLFDPLCHRFLERVADADIVHCSHYRIAVSQLAVLAGAALGRQTFVTDRGAVGLHFDPTVPVERCVSCFLAISEFSRSLLPDSVPTRVIHGGATESFLHAKPAPASPRPRRAPFVLYVGRIMRHKGIDTLIEALPTGMTLEVIGRVCDEEFFQLLRRLAEDRDVRFVHDAGDEQLLAAYRDALVTVLPSVYRDAFGGQWRMPELLGNVLLESMACATPAICTDVGGMPEVVRHGVTGFVVAPNDPCALSQRISELASDPAMAERMGSAGRDRVLERFTWERVAGQVLQAYAQC